ncbi:hypothetical protein ACIBQ6_21905 [Nonomuraea sp. NPDC049655]|uniref:hypothetical protein n=1 Tax=Nonomuraea sp. NPDC049655 TaxID=3364355 RepID=UPI0037973FDD
MDGNELRYLLKVRDDISQAMKDPRFPPATHRDGDLRMFAVTAIWVLGVERAPRGRRIQRVCEVMGLDNRQFWQLIRSDLPRYEPRRKSWDEGGCVVMLPRAKRPCGRAMASGFNVTNPVDGTWELTSYCLRHREEARAALAAEERRQQAGVPEPLPNTGGLLPCYLPWDWMKNYTKADSSWKPPKVGIRADDWPVLARVEMADPTPPRFKVVLGGVGHEPPGLEEADDAIPPSLQLITAASEETTSHE